MKKGKAIGFIPLRKGSTRILNKNVEKLGTKPLYRWVLDTALDSKLDEVYIFTDDVQIISECNEIDNPKLSVIKRSPQNADETASTESAILEFLEYVDEFDWLFLLQATSPFTRPCDINNALVQMKEIGYDSLVSVVKQKRFIWKKLSKSAVPVNYDPYKRPISQNYEGFLVENGAIYAMTKEVAESGCRVGGRVGLKLMPSYTYIEVDEPSDLAFLRGFVEGAY